MAREFWGKYKTVRVGVSRALKRGEILSPERALTMQYAARLAETALRDPQFESLNLEVAPIVIFQARDMLAKNPKPQLRPPALAWKARNRFEERRRRKERGEVALVNPRVRMDEASEAYFKHRSQAAFNYHRFSITHTGIGCDACQAHESRFPEEWRERVDELLNRAGIRFSDASPQNFAKTPEGKNVFLEVGNDVDLRIDLRAAEGFERHFGKATAERLRGLLREYAEKRKALEKTE